MGRHHRAAIHFVDACPLFFKLFDNNLLVRMQSVDHVSISSVRTLISTFERSQRSRQVDLILTLLGMLTFWINHRGRPVHSCGRSESSP